MPQVKEYFHDVDLKANQLFNSRLHNVTTSARISIGSSLGPSSRGYMVYDTDFRFPFFWNGVDWGEASGRQIPKWGEITGDITEQLDLTTYLSGNYYPLSDNPAGYLTAIPSLDEVLTVGNSAYNDISLYAASNLNMNSGSVTFAYDSLTSIGFLSSLTTGYTDIRNWSLPDASGVIPLTVNDIPADDFGNITISAGGGTWGSITGTVTDQTDLVDYLGLNYYPLSSNPAGYLTTVPIPTLQEVTDEGNVTTNNIIVGQYDTVEPYDYTELRSPQGAGLVFSRKTVGAYPGYLLAGYNMEGISYTYTADYTSGINATSTIRPKIDGTYEHTNDIYFPDASGTLPISVNGQTANNAGEITISIPSIGTGTTNYISKWNTSANGFINSRLYDGGIGGSIYNIDPPSNQFAYLINGYSGVGLSYGLLIAAGSNSTDTSFAIRTYAGNTNLFRIKGDGEIQIYTVPTTGTTSDYILLRDSSGNVKQIGYPTIPTVGTWGALNYPTWISGTPFVKMDAVGSFVLDTNTYLTSAVTSVDLTMPSAFTVTGNPVTTSGTLAVTGAGSVSQYIRGDGSLANFPNSTGGGASVNYYLNGSVSQGTFGGDTYYEMSKTPVLGAGTNFTRTNGSGNGYIASFITDVGDPNQLNIPGGNWNLEFYFNSSASGGSPSFYTELYKVDVTNVFTLIASGSVNPEGITNGTTVDQYFTSLPVPQTTLVATDRLAIRIFVTTGGRTITLHTENGNLAEVLTTLTTGLTALNGLTAQVQSFATGTSGTDFGISSTSATHTFNLPDASATARGVITTGTQTIAGTKTFSSNIKIPSIGSQLILQVNSDGTVNGMTTTIYPSPTELSYVKGVTSSIQTQLNSKQATITGAATTITSSDLTASRALISNASGKVAVSATTDTELGYVSGVTSAIQTQIENKVDKLQVANTMLANNTGGGANMTAQAFFDPGSQTYVGTITWSAPASQPSGATNHSYRWTRIGNMVTLNISLVYATASSGTQTNVTTTLPTDCPAPLEPPGLTAASSYMYPAFCNGGVLTSTSSTQTYRGGLRNNAANNGYEIIMSFSGTNLIYYNVTVTYWTA